MSLAYIPLFRMTEHAGARITLHRVYHYLKREPDEMYFGLGERAGVTNRAGQSYRLTNLDAMGYNARTTDPLYTHSLLPNLEKSDQDSLRPLLRYRG